MVSSSSTPSSCEYSLTCVLPCICLFIGSVFVSYGHYAQHSDSLLICCCMKPTSRCLGGLDCCLYIWFIYTLTYLYIHSDSVAVRNETAPGTVVLSGLTPYTLYIVQVEACTQFGCTRSSIVPQRTLEGSELTVAGGGYLHAHTTGCSNNLPPPPLAHTHPVPVGLASPIVSILGPTSASITWRELITI